MGIHALLDRPGVDVGAMLERPGRLADRPDELLHALLDDDVVVVTPRIAGNRGARRVGC